MHTETTRSSDYLLQTVLLLLYLLRPAAARVAIIHSTNFLYSGMHLAPWR